MLPKKLQAFFQEFGIVSVTLGIIIGASSVKLLQSFVDNLLMPLLRPIISDSIWEQATLKFGTVSIRFGLFLSDFFNFCIVLILTYFLVRKVMKYHRKK